MKRALPQRAAWALSGLRSHGTISHFEKLPDGRWLIYVPATRRDIYNDPDAHGEIVLTSREVFAFVEGAWAGRGVNPVYRAGSGETSG